MPRFERIASSVRSSSFRSIPLPTWSVVSTVLLVLSLVGCGNGYKFTGDHTDKDNYALKIDPAAPVITVGHTVHLTGASPWGSGADWSVLPASLGTIDGSGVFTAAATPGSGTVVAMWKGDVRYTATAAVKVVAAPNATITTSAAIITVNTAATASVPTQPGSTYTWAVKGGVLSGDQNAPQIQFTSAAAGAVQITCTVTDAAGDSANGHKSVTVIDVPPAIQYTPSSYTVTRGQPITQVRPISTGGAPTTWSISSGLLPGLAFDPTTGQITGTPSTLSSSVTYTITATNSGGSATATVTLTAVDPAPSIAYIPSTFTFTKGAAIASVVPTSSGGAVTSWSIAPAPPASLAFDTATGIITGTPTGLSSASSYTVNAKNTGGSATANLSIRVTDAPPVIHYNPSIFSLTKGAVFPTLVPTNTGGPAVTWAITPGLPAGLVFDTATGAISGTPTTLSPSATYSVIATNTGGASSAAILSIAVVDLPPAVGYSPSVFIFTKGQTITPIVPANTGGSATSWTLASPLPAGLSFNPATGRISGTPTALSSATGYTITATNTGGTGVPMTLTISVVDTPPVISYSLPSYTFTAGSPIPVLTPSNSGGFATSWTINAPLPLGLTFDPSTGRISGTPTGPSPSTVYTVTATNTGGASQPTTVTLNLVPAGTATITASNVNPPYGAPVTLTATFANAVSATIGTSKGASDTDPAALTGRSVATTPITSPRTYWLRTTNAARDTIDTSVIVTPQTVALSPITPASPTRSINTSTTFTATATGGATNGITWSASAGTINPSTAVWTAPPTAASVIITATAKVDPSKTATATVNVVATVTASISVSTTSPLYGATVAVMPTFANAATEALGTSAGASDLSSTLTSGSSVTSPALTTPTTFWLRATNAAGDSVDASKLVTPKTVDISPITATSINISAGLTTSLQATVANAVDTNVIWSAVTGNLAPTTTASAVKTTWTAPATAGAYTVTATSVADNTKKSNISINVFALPQANSLAVDNVNPLYGAPVHLLPNFSFGTGAVDNGIGSVTSGTPKTTAALTAPVTFTLTVTNAPGQTATVAAPLVTPQTVSVNTPVGANLKSTLTTGNTQAYTAAVHGAFNTAVTWTATCGSFTGNTWTAPNQTGTCTLTATSVADPTRFNSTVVTVVNPPIITMFAAADPLVSLNHPTTLTANFTNGSGTATIGTTGTGSSNITSAATSAGIFSTGALTATTTFTLTAYNEAGNSTSASVTVTVVTGSFSPTVSLSGPRYAHTNTLLPDGRVLIAGGRNASNALNTSQIYDPAVPSFSDAGVMVSARYGHTATLLANNTALLTGGNDGVNTTAQSELWNGTFASTGSLITAREKHTATLLLNGKVLVVGGLNGGSPVVSAELYDPATGAFIYTSGNLNTARYSHTATLLANGKVLLSGGYSGSVALKSAEVFDPSTGAFTVVGAMANGRQRHAAVLLNDGTVAMIGGQGTSAPLASSEIFNPTTNTFATAPGVMASPRDGLTATLIPSGKVIVAGGIESTGSPVKGSEIFDPSTGTFGLSGLLANPRTQHSATLLQSGQILLVGGLVGAGSTATAELLDPQDGLTPTIPNAAVTGPTGALRAQAGLTASAPIQTHVQYVWMITGGAISAGAGTNSVTVTMPSSGPAKLDLLVTSDRLIPSHTQFVVTPKPVISAFTATKSTVTVSNSTNLNWTVQDATSLSLSQNIGAVTGTSAPVTPGTLGITTYTLTATNAGGSVTANTNVYTVAPPVAASLTATALTVPVGGNTALIPAFSQGTGAIDGGVGAVLSGPAYPTAAISNPTTFTLTVTNAAGDIAQKSVVINLQPVSVTGIVGPQYVSAGRSAAYTATVIGSVNTAVSWSTAAGAIDAAGHLTAPNIAPYSSTQTPLTITATSTEGGTPGSFTAQIVPLPNITSFTSNLASVTYGGSVSITPVFTNGTGQILGLGSVTSGQPVSTGTLTASKTYTLLVTNPAGDSVSQDLTVNPGAISVTTPVTSSGPIVTAGDQIQFSASTIGSANAAVTWSADRGTFSGSSWTAPAAGTYIITASSVSPTGYFAAASITVVDAPTITSFTSADSSLQPNGSTTLAAVFAGGTATVNPGAITPTTGISFPTGALSATTTFTIAVTNSATNPKSTTRTVTVNILKGATSKLPTLMGSARVGHTVTLLTDGTVLIAGGSSSNLADIYNAVSQTVTSLSSPMQSVRFFHTATLMTDGRVLLAGGSDSSTTLNTAEIFDPSTGAFTATANPMTTARKNHNSALMGDGRVLLSGGLDASGTALDSTEIFDPLAGTFTAAPSLSSARELSTSTALENGNILLAGGDDTSTASNAGQSFDGTAFSDANLVQARSLHTATLLPTGDVLLAGGISGSTPLQGTETYGGASFTAGSDLLSPRYGHVANLLASGQVLLTGGTADGSAPLKTSLLFDPVQAKTFATSDLSTARFQPSSTILRNGKVLIAGGTTNVTSELSSSLQDIELFDPQDNLALTLPSATLTAPTYASAGTTGLTASVQAQGNVRYVWTLTNGAITSGLNTRSITFTKAAAGPSVLNVLVISDREVPVQSSVTISTAPSINIFTATPSTNTAGLPTTLNWSVTGATGLSLSLDNGIGDVTSLGGSTAVVTPSASTTYTLTATDTNGTTTRSVTLQSLPVPVAQGLTAAVNPIEKGSSTTVLPTFSNGIGTIDNGVGTVLSGVAYTTGSLNSATILTLTVTNSVGTAVTRTLTVNLLPVVVGSITGPANVSVGSSSTQFSAAVTGAVDKSVTWSTSAGSITPAGVLTAPSTTGDVVITATSVADPTQHRELTVHIVALPVATGITAATNPVLYGSSTTITPQFSLGTATIDQGIGTVTTGTAYTTGTITADKTFTLTVTNPSGTTATFSYTVHPQTVVVGPISGPVSGKVTQGRSATFNATVTGAANTAVTWNSASAGSFSGNRWTAPNTTGTYTITATAVNGATSSLSITVIAAPAISSFTATPAGINKNQSSTLTANFVGAGSGSNVTGVVTPGNLTLRSGGASVSTGPLAGTQTYTLTVTNDAGDTATAQTTVQVFLGAFSATVNMLTPARNLPTATLGTDGNVLLAGGGSASNAANLFNSSTLSFSVNPSTLATGRNGHTSTLLPNGLILIAGGSDGSASLAGAELYNPADSSFTATGSLNQPRHNHRAILLDSGKVLLVGGATLNSAEIFDPATAQFTLTGAMTTPREFPTVSRLPDGRVLVAGGLNGSSRLATAEIFDPSTNTFSTAANMLQARALHTATTLPSGEILFAGGAGNNGTGSAELFNPSLERFTSTGNMVQPRQEHIARLLAGGMVLLAGGNNGASPNAIDQAELFDPSQGGFLKTDFMSTTGAPSTGAAANLLPSGKVLVTGGTSDGSAPVSGSELYTPTDGLIASAADPTVTVPAFVPQGATAVAAHVTAVGNARYIWMVTNGSLVSGQGTSSVLFNMAASGNATLDVLIVTDRLVPSHGHSVVIGEPAPAITSLTAAANPVLYGSSTSITPTFTNALGGAVIGTGVAGSSDISSAASSGVAVELGPLTAPIQYRLTVTNRAGVSINQTLTVGVQSIIVSAITPQNPILSINDSRTFSATVSQVVNTGIVWSATGGTINPSTGAWTAPSTPGTYTIRATSAADNTTSAVTTATVIALPSIQSFTATPLSVNYGQAASLTPVFTGSATGKASIGTAGTGSSQLSSTATSSATLSTGALTANTTFTLTVANAAGSVTSATVQANVIQPFSPTASMALARLGQTTTSLPDGSVLIAGGTDAPDKAEIYTAGTGAFVSTQPMQATRSQHTATLLPTGQVLLVGGTDATGALASAELFDPSTSTFTPTVGTLAHARQNHTAALLPDGRVLIVGGSNATENQLASAEIFDPATSAFTAVATSLSAAREFATATTLNDGRILVAGGFSGTAYLSTADIFSNGAFTTPALAMGSSRAHHTATLLPSGKVLLSGGYDGSARLATSTLFTPGAPDSFANAGNMTQSRQNAAATLLSSGKVLVAGGADGTSPRSSAELFDPTSTSFTTTGSMLTARSGEGSGLLLDGTVLLAGGTIDGTARLSSAEIFDPQDALTPFQPDATVLPSVTHATLGATGLTATASAHTGNRYIWLLRNGTITAGQGTPSVTFSMSTSGDALLDLLVLSDHLVPAHSTVTIAADPLPSLTAFTAALNPVPYGGSTTLTPVFSNATGVKLGTAGYGSSDISNSVTSGAPVAVGPLTSIVAYTLTLPEVVGNKLSSTLIVNVLPVLVSPISPSAPSVTAGHTQSFSAAVSQAVDTGIVWSATGGTINPATGAWTAPPTPGAYTIKATSAADKTTVSSTSATVVNLPSISSFTASSANVNYGQTTSLTPVFTAPAGSQATITATSSGSTQLAANVLSATAISTGALTASTTFTLTVTNAAGDSAASTVIVSVNLPFSAAGSMALARSGQTTTQLPDGTVLVAGGTAAADKAEIYNPGTGTFSVTTSAMNSTRKNHTATLLSDGKILFTGGSDGPNTLSTAELYDPSSGVFTVTAGTMVHARQNHSAALLTDGRVLILGGSNPTEDQLSATEIYDPATGGFAALGSALADARESATATSLLNGDVLVTGGTGTNGAPLNSAELYSNGTFGSHSFPMRSARLHHTATLLPGGSVLLSGGFDGFTRLASAEIYTGGSTSSSFVPATGSMGTAREQHTATLLANGKLLLSGGSEGSNPLASAELFDPAAQTFTLTGNLITARFGAGAALLQTGKVLIVGGTNSAALPVATAELFDPQDGQTPVLSTLNLSAPSTARFGTQQTASITLPTNAFCIWSVDNGTSLSGAGTPTLKFIMGSAGHTTLHVLVVTSSGLPLLATQGVTGQ